MIPQPPRWFQFSYLTALTLAIVTTFALCYATVDLRDKLNDVRTEASDKRRERDAAYKLFRECSESLEKANVSAKEFDESCRGMNCKEMFSNDAAGVVSTTYLGYDLGVVGLIDFCHHDERVNLGKNYPGSHLASVNTINHSGNGKEYYLATCNWFVPSPLWCAKDAMNP